MRGEKQQQLTPKVDQWGSESVSLQQDEALMTSTINESGKLCLCATKVAGFLRHFISSLDVVTVEIPFKT